MGGSYKRQWISQLSQKKQDINVVPELKGNIFTQMNSSVVCLFLGLNGI